MLVEPLTIEQYRQTTHAERTTTEEVGRIVAIPSKSESEQSDSVDWPAVGQYIGEHRRRLGLSKNEASRRARGSNTTGRQNQAGQDDPPDHRALQPAAPRLPPHPAAPQRHSR